MRHDQPQFSREPRGRRGEGFRGGRGDGRFRGRESDDWNERQSRGRGYDEDDEYRLGYGGGREYEGEFGGQGQYGGGRPGQSGQSSQDYYDEGPGDYGQYSGQRQYSGRHGGQGHFGGQGQYGGPSQYGGAYGGQYGGQSQQFGGGWDQGYFDEPQESQGRMGQMGGHYGQMGQMSRGRQGLGRRGQYGQDMSRGRTNWQSQPGYGLGGYSGGYGDRPFEEQGGRMGRGRGRSEFAGQGPKGYTRSDDRIKEEVCEMLSDADVDVSDVSVKVQNGEVILEGSVDSRWSKREVEDIVCDARGVRDCQNHLKISAEEEEEGTSASARGRGRQDGGNIGTSVSSRSSGAMS